LVAIGIRTVQVKCRRKRVDGRDERDVDASENTAKRLDVCPGPESSWGSRRLGSFNRQIELRLHQPELLLNLRNDSRFIGEYTLGLALIRRVVGVMHSTPSAGQTS
jgi:hypothetical protein